MSKPLKVFSGAAFIYDRGGKSQKEVCIATPSRAAAVRGLQAQGLRITENDVRTFWTESGNEAQIQVTHSEPGIPFYRDYSSREPWQRYVKE